MQIAGPLAQLTAQPPQGPHTLLPHRRDGRLPTHPRHLPREREHQILDTLGWTRLSSTTAPSSLLPQVAFHSQQSPQPLVCYGAKW